MPVYGIEASESWRHALRVAESYARKFHHSQVGPGHLLLGVLDTCNALAMDFCREYGRHRFEFEGVMTSTVAFGLTDNAFVGDTSPEVAEIYRVAREQAVRRRHEVYSVEHLLLALLMIPNDGASVVRSMLSQLDIDANVALIWVTERVDRLNFAIPKQRRYSTIFGD